MKFEVLGVRIALVIIVFRRILRDTKGESNRLKTLDYNILVLTTLRRIPKVEVQGLEDTQVISAKEFEHFFLNFSIGNSQASMVFGHNLPKDNTSNNSLTVNFKIFFF